MPLYLGNDYSLASNQIVCILNLNRVQTINNPDNPISWIGKPERIRRIGKGPYHSLVLSKRGTIYFTTLDVRTLAKRLNQNRRWYLRKEIGESVHE
jgi:hypothetical protein